MLIAFAGFDTKTGFIEIGGADDSRHSTQSDRRSFLTVSAPCSNSFHPIREAGPSTGKHPVRQVDRHSIASSRQR